MRLHQNTELFNQAIRATAQRMNILDIYIEKDYWVCYALYLIFNSTEKDCVVFKGGTALSKCYGFIERFSEDIDLVVLTGQHQTGNQKKQQLKKITNTLVEPFIEVYQEGITNKLGEIRKVAFNYPKAFKGEFGQARDKIVLEASIFGSSEPFGNKTIATYIYGTMLLINQQDLAKEFQLEPFEIKVLDVRRTLCEKIMSLVRFSNTATPITDLKNKIRHLYDIHKLLSIKDIFLFFTSPKFEIMLKTVAQDDIISYRNQTDWLQNHPKDAIVFKESDNVWMQLKMSYNNEFKNLVYGDLPDESEILKTINEVAHRLETLVWDIKI